MNTYSFARKAAIAAVLALYLVGVGVGPATAQDGNQTAGNAPTTPNATLTSTATATPIDGASAEPNLDLSATLRLVRWEYSSGVWKLTLRSTVPAPVTVTDASQVAEALTSGSGKATGTADYRTYVLDPGTQTISFDGSKFQSASAVTVAPSGPNGQIAILRTEAFGAEETLIKQSTAALLVAVSAVGAGWGTYRRLKDRLADETKAAERHL